MSALGQKDASKIEEKSSSWRFRFLTKRPEASAPKCLFCSEICPELIAQRVRFGNFPRIVVHRTRSKGSKDFGMSFGNPDFVRYAQAYGAKGSRVSAVEDLVPTLEAAFAGGGVHLVDVPIDYSENTRVLVDELRNRNPNVERA